MNYSLILNIDSEKNLDEINLKINNGENLKECYRFTTINLPYKEVVKKLETSPYTRGQKRKTYELIGEREKRSVIYSLLLKAIELDPPIISISLEPLPK
ncbi:hypothetical protein B4099_0163 [Heyndrickxia coagulans]|uniref:Uncharacterized protein n=1 Tax=Heyndrickxia coagulans TaxID=1398 RepID=A0A150K1E6_HEYCO|nr:hypothetical protein B4099_0163 [Heyndrickxia coagulans]